MACWSEFITHGTSSFTNFTEAVTIMGKTEVENNPYGVGNQQLFEQSLQKGRKSDIAASRKYNFG